MFELKWNDCCLTTEEVADVERCKNDIVYFCEEYCYVKKLDGRLNRVQPTPWQTDYLEKNEKNMVYVNSRQIGFSTISAVKVLHQMIFSSDSKRIGYFDVSKTLARKFLEMVSVMYDELPYWMRCGVKGVYLHNKDIFELNDGSCLICSIAGIDFSRDYFHILLFDNVDYWNYKDYCSVMSSLSYFRDFLLKNGNPRDYLSNVCFASSITEGDNIGWSPIRELIPKVIADKGYIVINPWYVAPYRDKRWFKDMKKLIGDRAFDLEYCCKF